MTTSLTSWLRKLGLLTVIGVLAAAALGKYCGVEPASRSPQPVKFIHFSVADVHDFEPELTLVDVETGTMARIALPDGDVLDSASLSPWQEQGGQGQMVGRWTSWSGRAEGGHSRAFGLARYTQDGKPLNRVVSEVAPEGPPCWYPGTRARILFAGGDRVLHHFAFEDASGPEAGPDGCELKPQPIAWKIPPPGEGEGHVQISDPVWPEERIFGGRLVVSLSVQVREDDRPRFLPPRLWWIQLDRDGSAIEAAGPLTERRPPGRPGQGRRPRLIRTASGDLRLAFLTRRPGQVGWSLAVADVEFDESGTPHADASAATILADHCAISTLAFSPDARWVYYLPKGPPTGGTRRVAVPPALRPDRRVAMR